MKKGAEMRFKHLFLILTPFLIFLSFCILFVILLSISTVFYKIVVSRGIDRLIENNKCIVSVEEIWEWDENSKLFPPIPYALDIKMENDKRIFLSWINSMHLKAPFYIAMIDNNVYRAHASRDVSGKFGGGNRIPIKLIGEGIKIQLKSVDDVIKNYDVLSTFMNSFITWDSYINHKEQSASNVSWIQYGKPVLFKGQYWRIINTTQDPDEDMLRKMDDSRIGQRHIHVRTKMQDRSVNLFKNWQKNRRTQLRRIVKEYIGYYNNYRPLQGLGGIPNAPPEQPPTGEVKQKPLLFGLHNHYYREVA
jgi:hypothetical protein